MFSCARRSRAADISFIARVIFCVFLTVAMRLRMILRLPAGIVLLALHREQFAERLERLLELGLVLIVELLALADVGEQLLVRALEILEQLLLVAAQHRERVL